MNHPDTILKNVDINDIKEIDIKKDTTTLLFGGAPCQGFSTSNQKTRTKDNPSNWLFQEFVRLASNGNQIGLFLKTSVELSKLRKSFF